MFKPIEPKKQRHCPPVGTGAYVRVAPRLIMISNEAGRIWGNHRTCNVSIDAPNHVMVFSPDGPWKLSTVCETRHAKRIETRTAVNSFLEAGFPKGLLGHYLPCHVGLDGSLIVSLMVDFDKVKSA